MRLGVTADSSEWQTLKNESSSRYVLIYDFLINELRRRQNQQIENEKKLGGGRGRSAGSREHSNHAKSLHAQHTEITEGNGSDFC